MVKKILLILILSYLPLLNADPIPQMIGGYNPISIRDPEVVSAADFATQQIGQGPLVSILSAQTQVVAGTNYAMVLEIVGNDNLSHSFSVVVFVPLPTAADQSMQLTEVEDLGAIQNPNLNKL